MSTTTLPYCMLSSPTAAHAVVLFLGGGQNNGYGGKDLLAAAGKVDASCNVATGEVIPAPFRLSGFLLCNIPIVATMLFSKSVYVQVRVYLIRLECQM